MKMTSITQAILFFLALSCSSILIALTEDERSVDVEPTVNYSENHSEKTLSLEEQEKEVISKAADLNIQEAENLFKQAEIYLVGSGGQRSYPLAIKFYQRAADAGHVKAQEKLLWLNAYLPNEPSLKKRYRRELQAAKEDKAEAQFIVAEMCEYGLGVEADRERAIAWYKKSAEKNYGKAQNRLGELYADGTLKEDSAGSKEQAFLWIQSAANNNQAQAQFKLAEFYRSGENGFVEANSEKAFFWFQKSAENDHIQGQMQTAFMLKTGEGVKQNYEQALYWYEKAWEQEYSPAQEQVKEMNTLLDDIFLKNFK